MEIASIYSLYLDHPVICTDTRKITPGCIFIALTGSNYDGNAFASEAIKLGAAYAIVSDRSQSGTKFIHVDDTLETLQTLANYHRKKLQIPLIAITGSNGKTTTKDLITCVLSSQYKVHATSGNLNNHIGVPLTILSTPFDTDIIVCEMGANHIGEIKALCEIAMPTHGIITNIGKAHLEGFGSIEGVQKAKGELFDYLALHNGLAFVNIDESRLNLLAKDLPNKITFGFNPLAHPDIHFNYCLNENNGGFTIKDQKTSVQIQSDMFGSYNASNVLAAYTIGEYFHVENQKVVAALSSFNPGTNRSETISYRGCTIIKDAYNANPTSMELALKAFAQRYPGGWVILGDMKELGEESIHAHQQIISLILELGFQYVLLIGKEFKEALQKILPKSELMLTADHIEDVKDNWNWEKCEGQTLLLKGSRSMHLEKLLDN